MPFEREQLRLERVNFEVAYDAAFTFWNLRGVVAERWGHGPDFGAISEPQHQVNLSPPTEAPDQRLQAVYGLKFSGLLAEGEVQVPRARELADEWFQDVFTVLRPRRAVRASAQVFGLYPVADASQVSRRLRSHFYRNDNLQPVLPERLRRFQDSFHAAVNWLVVDGDRLVSLIAGAVGPPHQGQFFTYPDPERDGAWWLGINVLLGRINADRGVDEPLDTLRALIANAYADFDHIAPVLLRPVIP